MRLCKLQQMKFIPAQRPRMRYAPLLNLRDIGGAEAFCPGWISLMLVCSCGPSTQAPILHNCDGTARSRWVMQDWGLGVYTA